MKNTWILGIGLMLIAAALVYGSVPAAGGSCDEAARSRVSPGRVTFLPPEVSRSLDLTSIGRPGPEPIVVGTYWTCLTDPDTGIENCDIVLVACTDNQEVCVEL